MRGARGRARISPPPPAGRASTTKSPARPGRDRAAAARSGVTDAEIAFPLLTVTGHARRSRVVTPLRVKKPGRRITPVGCFMATLLGLAVVYGAVISGAGIADAADGRHTRAEAMRHHRTVLPARG